MNIKVSVIIPTYGRKTTLERALYSIINQSYENIEIVVIDDNDPLSEYREKTAEIIKKIDNKCSNLIYIQNERNMGSAKTRNIGISKASGDYITFLDDDDIYKPNKINKQLDFMIKNNLDMCFTDLILKNEAEKIVGHRTRDDLKNFHTDELLKYHIMHHLTGTDTFMYKAELLCEIGGFDLVDIGDEFYLMLKTIESGAKIGYLADCDVIAYVHNSQGGLSTGNNKVAGENSLFEFKKNYSSKFTKKEWSYVEFRHYVVLSFAYIKRRQYFLAVKYVGYALFCSPISALKNTTIVIKYIKKRLKVNGEYNGS
jgi:glycosyltransferase involved in cell wall biosynthesis